MNQHDLFLLSPEISVVGLALAIIVLDILVQRKGIVAAVAVVGLALPLGFSIALWMSLDGGNTAVNTGILGTTLLVAKFSLFFKFLLIGTAAAGVLISTDYVKRFERFQAEYYALVLFSVSGMMLLASASEMITLYIALELTALPIAALAAFLRDSRSSESGMKFLILILLQCFVT